MGDLTWELIGLGIDALVCGIVYQVYRSTRDTITALKSAVPLNATCETCQIVSTTPASSIPYVVIKGTVKALDAPIRSVNSTVTGVIQKISRVEHKTTYYPTGFWFDKEHVIQATANSVPWVLRGKTISVEVTDSMFADYLELQSVSDNFVPTDQGLTGFLAGWVAGERVKGVQNLEEMLVEGSLVTVFGEVVAKNGDIFLQPPSDGKPYIITSMSPSSIIKSFQLQQSRTKLMLVIPAGLGIFLICMIARRLYMRYSEKLRKGREDSMREQIRRDRRDTSSLRDDQLCVACLENPREVIMLPCGHVCTCIDCAEKLTERRCPVCRSNFDSFVRAFLS